MCERGVNEGRAFGLTRASVAFEPRCPLGKTKQQSSKLWMVSVCGAILILLNLVRSSELVMYEISQLLNTGLDKDQLAICLSMIESGVNPEGLAVRRGCTHPLSRL